MEMCFHPFVLSSLRFILFWLITLMRFVRLSVVLLGFYTFLVAIVFNDDFLLRISNFLSFYEICVLFSKNSSSFVWKTCFLDRHFSDRKNFFKRSQIIRASLFGKWRMC